MWRISSRFILTPLIITKVGLEGYGTWTLLFGICAYVSMFNASFGIAYSKFTAEYDCRKDYDGLSKIIASGIVVIGGLAFVALAGIWLLRDPILRTLNVPDALLPDAGLALLIISLCVLLRMSLGCVFQILAGLQRMDLQYKLGILASMLDFGVAVWLLIKGKGLLALAFGHLFGQVLTTAVAWVLCRRLCPALRISPFQVSRSGLRSVLSLGGRFQLLSFLRTFMGQGLKMLISGFCGVSHLAVFELGDKLLNLAKSLSGALIAPLMPAFAHLHSGKDASRARSLYLQSSKIVALSSVTCFACLVLFADRLIVVWTGQEYPLAVWTIRVLAAGHFLLLMTGVGTASLRGKGTIRLELSYAIIVCALITILAVPGYLLGGYKGVILAVLASLLTGSIWFLAAFSREEGINRKLYVNEVFVKGAAIGALATCVAVFLSPVTNSLVPMLPERWEAVFVVAVWGSAFALGLSVALWFAIFSTAERQYFIQRIIWRRSGVRSTSELRSP